VNKDYRTALASGAQYVYHNKRMLFHTAGSDVYQGYRQTSLLQMCRL